MNGGFRIRVKSSLARTEDRINSPPPPNTTMMLGKLEALRTVADWLAAGRRIHCQRRHAKTRGVSSVVNTLVPDVYWSVFRFQARPKPACQTVQPCFLVFYFGLGIYTGKPVKTLLPNEA